jgi:putative redox protein
MTETMRVSASYDEGTRFIIESGSGHTVTMDGDHLAALSPMEMVLASLASCSGISVLSILQKRREDITNYEVRVQGVRAAEHPKVFTDITIEHIFTGHSVRPASIERAIELAETRYCGVSIMLSQAAELTNTYRIIEID